MQACVATCLLGFFGMGLYKEEANLVAEFDPWTQTTEDCLSIPNSTLPTSYQYSTLSNDANRQILNSQP